MANSILRMRYRKYTSLIIFYLHFSQSREVSVLSDLVLVIYWLLFPLFSVFPFSSLLFLLPQGVCHFFLLLHQNYAHIVLFTVKIEYFCTQQTLNFIIKIIRTKRARVLYD